MRPNSIRLKLLIVSIIICSTALMGTEDRPKRTINGNMTLNYNILPQSVDNIGDMFSNGIFYGRLRTNTFYWEWSDSVANSNSATKNMGIGGSLIYKSAQWNNFSFTLGYYSSTSPNFWRPDSAFVGKAKAGKDTFSRYRVSSGGDFVMNILGQGYMEYNSGTIDIKAGRQLFESVFTKSNDTKMIPNTFDGISSSFKIAPKTTLRVAWFDRQKLRNHESNHDVITFKDSSANKWNNNDDAGIHKGLTYANFVTAGKSRDNDLYIADLSSKYIQNLNFTASYLQIPGVLKDIVIEAHYKIPLFNSGWSIRPGIRHFIQIDDGGGVIAGDTNLAGKKATTNGYNSGVATSLNSSLFNARVDILMPDKKGFFRLGYSKVEDRADIIAPWRGFPTGGFTRAMAQYNWTANTQTFMIRGVYKFNSIWKASIRYAIEDFDDNKDFVNSDSSVIHIDTWTNITQNIQMRMRYGHIDAEKNIAKIHTGGVKTDWSYDEFRLEFNYLF